MGSKAFEESKLVVACKDQISQAEQYPFFLVSTLSLLGLVNLVCANTR